MTDDPASEIEIHGHTYRLVPTPLTHQYEECPILNRWESDGSLAYDNTPVTCLTCLRRAEIETRRTLNRDRHQRNQAAAYLASYGGCER